MHHAGIELTIWYISYIYVINILSTIAFSILWNTNYQNMNFCIKYG